MSLQDIPADILNDAAAAVEAMPQRPPFKADMLKAIAKAVFAERQKHDRPASPDLQAEAERVFYKVDKTPWKDDCIQIIALALLARDERAAAIARRFGSTPAPAADSSETRILQAVDGHQIAAAILSGD